MFKLAKLFTLLFVLTLFIPLTSSATSDNEATSSAQSYQWSFVGPYGGDVRSLVIDPSDPKRLYLGTNDGQIYRSTDGANNWTRLLSFDHPGYSIDRLVIDETNPKVIYAPVWLLASDTVGTIYKTTDGGDNWQELTGITGHSVRNFAIAPSNNKFLIAAAMDGAYLSTDAGQTWKRYSPVNHPDIVKLHSVAIDPKNTDIVYLGTPHLPWKTEDGGKTWTLVKGHPTEKKLQLIDDSDIFSIVVDSKEEGRVFASACSGIYTSTDNAQTWTKYQGIPFTSRRTHTIYPDPTNNKIIYSGTTEGLWKTVDGGQIWRLMTSNRTIVNAIAIHPSNPNIVYLGLEAGGVHVSNDGGNSFRPVNAGFVNRQVSTLIADRSVAGRIYASVLFNGREGGLFISNDNGKSWQLSTRGMAGDDVFTIYQSTQNDKVIYAGTNLGLYRSVDRGESWARVGGSGASSKSTGKSTANAAAKTTAKTTTKTGKGKSGKSTKAVKYTTPAKITDRVVNIVPAAQGGLLVAAWSGLYQVSDDGRVERYNITNLNGRVLSVANPVKQPETIYVGTTSGLRVTRDNGKTWQPLPLSEGLESSPIVQAISASPNDANVLIIGTQVSCYMSRDGGNSWSRRGRGVPYGEALAIRFSDTNPDVVALGDFRGGGVYLSIDGGENFKRIDRDLPSLRISTLSFDNLKPSRVYVGSFSGGVYVLDAGPLASIKKEQVD